MFAKLMNKLFGGGEATVRQERIVEFVDGLDDTQLPLGKMLCVFERDRLVNYCHEEAPASPRDRERWYLVPSDDLPLFVRVPLERDETATLATEVSIRFEPESELFSLIGDRDFLTRDDLMSLLTSQLSGLVEMEGFAEPSQLEQMAEFEAERLRARFSLLLQARGLRCTHLGAFTVVETQAVGVDQADDEEIYEDVPVEVVDEESIRHGSPTATPPRNELPAEPVFEEAVCEVQTADDWSALLSTLESSGCQFSEQSAEELAQLGDDVLDRKVQAKEVAVRLRRMADDARQRAGVPDPQLPRWRGLAFRLDAVDFDDEDYQEYAGGPSMPVKRRPWTFWMFSRKSIDDKLCRFLNTTLRKMRSAFDEYRSQQRIGPELVKLRKIDQRLGLAMDQLETMPTLSPSQSNLRLSRRRVKELVREVEGAVTAAETAQAGVKQMVKVALGGEDWQSATDEVVAALDKLNDQLRNRRDLR